LKSQDHEVGNPPEVSTKLTDWPTIGFLGLSVKSAVGAPGDWVKVAEAVAFPVIVNVVDTAEPFENVPPVPDHFPKTQPDAGEAKSAMAVPDVYPWVQVFALAVTVPPALGLDDTASV
jgi:hypothetical protein